MECSVHRYKYSQDKRRLNLKRMMRDGVLKFIGRTKTHFHYEIINIEEYKKRK